MSVAPVRKPSPSGLEQVYRYSASSALHSLAGEDRLLLSTSGGTADHPHLFAGWVTGSRPAALAMLLLAGVAGTRFHSTAFRADTDRTTESALLENLGFRVAGFARGRYADPVVTSHRDRLRLESFSACGSVYARLDLPPSAIDGAFFGAGTTNVDFGPDLLRALAGVRERERFFLEVGTGGVTVSTGKGRFVERKVKLPLRWVKGFGEVQAMQSRMRPQAELSRVEAVRFVRSLPVTRGRSLDRWLVPTNGGLRTSQTAQPGAVPAAGLERLLLLQPLAAYIDRLRVHSLPDQHDFGATAWEVRLGTAVLHLVLSPGAGRGFSGEGQLLTALADFDACEAAQRLRGRLDWQAALDPDALGEPRLAQAALDVLAVSGAVGYDLTLGAHFHRELPYRDVDRLTLHPRLREAFQLADAGAVEIVSLLGEPETALVTSGGSVYSVRLAGVGTCNCPWYGRHQGDRGPCKHVLAVRLVVR